MGDIFFLTILGDWKYEYHGTDLLIHVLIHYFYKHFRRTQICCTKRAMFVLKEESLLYVSVDRQWRSFTASLFACLPQNFHLFAN